MVNENGYEKALNFSQKNDWPWSSSTLPLYEPTCVHILDALAYVINPNTLAHEGEIRETSYLECSWTSFTNILWGTMYNELYIMQLQGTQIQVDM